MAVPNPLAEQLLALSREISAEEAKLAAAQGRIAALKAQFTQLVEQAQGAPLAMAHPPPNAIWFDGGTLGDRAAGFINQRPLELLDAPTIASGIGVPPGQVPSLRTTLNRLVERKAIASPVRGAFTSNTAEYPPGTAAVEPDHPKGGRR